MKTNDMKVGALYLLMNGRILRYQGPWGLDNHAAVPEAHCLAFSPPREGLMSPAVGYSSEASRVIRALRHVDIPWLQKRMASEKVRNLDWEETRHVIYELERQQRMDPNTALRKMREATAAIKQQDDSELDSDKKLRERRSSHVDYEPLLEIVEHFEALDGWLTRGGFLPTDWDKNR